MTRKWHIVCDENLHSPTYLAVWILPKQQQQHTLCSYLTLLISYIIASYLSVWPGVGVKPNSLYRASNETLTTVYSLFTHSLWPILSASLILSCLAYSPGENSTLHSVTYCTTQDSVNSYVYLDPALMDLYLMLGFCYLADVSAQASQCRLLLGFHATRHLAQVASFCELPWLQDTVSSSKLMTEQISSFALNNSD